MLKFWKITINQKSKRKKRKVVTISRNLFILPYQ